ncbi:hypothetical protein CCUS01_09497 [Colletotrichum cuscutae]|uniref:DUF7580 domain-containing protein n=1 Tax=Colletotrichum cuscutae TaxID=1209917 RepID=A0AAI9UH87_9PEZI|nr:hypothetical protein CCUS01_09497 [Colletotrichum cuscutae]
MEVHFRANCGTVTRHFSSTSCSANSKTSTQILTISAESNMSGFEIAGLVLGSIPLITKAFDDYKRVIATTRTWRNYDREKICEKLLSCLVSPNDFELMIEDPFGPLWKQEGVQRKIKSRLYRSFDTFQHVMEDMEAAINDIKQCLGLDAQGKAKWTEESTIIKEFKRASFALNKSTYKYAIDTIRKDISALESIIDTNIHMEPVRKQRYKGRLAGLIRQVSANMYFALRNSISCDCDCRHQVHLDLTPDSEDATHDLDDAAIIEKIGLQLAMTYQTDTGRAISEKPGQQNLWEEVTVRASAPQATYTLETTPTPQSPARPKRRVVSFASSRQSTITTTRIEQPTIARAMMSTMPALNLSSRSINLTRQVNLCAELRRGHEKAATDIYGTISHQSAGKSWKFAVYPKAQPNNQHVRSAMSLKQILEDPLSIGIPYVAKLHLAKMISSSFLQLHQTPWLPNILTNQDVFFIKNDSQSLLDYRQAFIMKEFPEKAREDVSLNSDARNPALLSLGILPLELKLGTTIERLRHRYEMSGDGTRNFDYDALVAQRLLQEMPADSEYFVSAVQRCIGAGFGRSKLDLNDEAFRQDVYEKIVAPLEADLAASTL